MFAFVATTMAGESKKEKRGAIGISDGLHGLHEEGIQRLHAPLATGYSSYAANYPAPLLSSAPAISSYAAPFLSAAPAINHLPAISSYAHSTLPALPALSHIQPAIPSYAAPAPLLSSAPAISHLPAISSYAHSALPVQHFAPAPIQHYSAPLSLPVAAAAPPAFPIQHYSAAPIQHYSAPLASQSFHHAGAPAVIKSYAPSSW